MTAEAARIRDELRRRASVLVEFELAWLGLDLDSGPAQEALAGFLSEDATLGPMSSGDRSRWRVGEGVRRSCATEGIQALRTAWGRLARRPDHPLQRMIDRLIGAGLAVRLEALSRSELQELAQVSRWFDAAGAPVPPFAELDQRLRFEQMLDPLRAVVTEYFRDRDDELRRLGRRRSSGPTLVTGRGGIGKTALLAKHLLASSRSGARVCWLSFDHHALDPLQPGSIVAEIGRQLGLQSSVVIPAESYFASSSASSKRTFSEQVSQTTSRDVYVRSESWVYHLRSLADRFSDRRVVLVLDTLEEAQRHDWELDSVRLLVAECAGRPGWQVIVSGRAPVEWIRDRLDLQGLPKPEAVALLAALLAASDAATDPVRLSRTELDEIVDLTSTSPLCIRLAAGVLRSAGGETGALRDLGLRSGMIEGELYRRLLHYIPDQDVRRIAYPGLILRRITPELIRTVLARPCGIAVPDEVRARELFDGLAREAMLVERGPDHDLLHRSDVRPLMLGPLSVDKAAEVRAIHSAAIAYYTARDDPASRVEELYHRLMLGQSERTLDEHWHSDALHDLAVAVHEFPPAGRAYLLQRSPGLESRFTAADLSQIDESRRRPVIQRQVDQLLASAKLRDALRVVRRERTADGAPLLPLLELQVLELSGDLDSALAVGQAEERRLARLGDTLGVVNAALHCARLNERLGHPRAAALHLCRLSSQLDAMQYRSVDPLTRLRLLTTRLRLGRFGARVDRRETLVADAIALFDGIPESTLRSAPELLRDLCGELGPEAPVAMLTLALDTGVLVDSDGAVGHALEEFDSVVSHARGRDKGVLADQVIRSPKDVDVDNEAWTQWIGSAGSSSSVADRVSSIIKSYEPEMPGSVNESITRSFRKESDDATYLTFE